MRLVRCVRVYSRTMTMTDLLSLSDCHARALAFSKRAATCASPKAQSLFANIAKNWIAMAFELEMQRPLFCKEHKREEPEVA